MSARTPQVFLGVAHVVACPDSGPLIDCESKCRDQLAVGIAHKTTGGRETYGGASSYPLSTCSIASVRSSFARGPWRFARERIRSAAPTRISAASIGLVISGAFVRKTAARDTFR